jgi:hypothetical protein
MNKPYSIDTIQMPHVYLKVYFYSFLGGLPLINGAVAHGPMDSVSVGQNSINNIYNIYRLIII